MWNKNNSKTSFKLYIYIGRVKAEEKNYKYKMDICPKILPF